jgi:hypothetical protein
MAADRGDNSHGADDKCAGEIHVSTSPSAAACDGNEDIKPESQLQSGSRMACMSEATCGAFAAAKPRVPNLAAPATAP